MPAPTCECACRSFYPCLPERSYYGAEQAMGGNGTGSAWQSANRRPLWEAGYGVGAPMYTFIRTMAW